MEKLQFSEAHVALKKNLKVKRSSWTGWILLKRPTATSEINVPFIAYKNEDHDLVPYHVSQADLLAEDWEIVL